MAFFVYILASRRNGTLYVGHTDDLAGRVWQHKEAVGRGFTSKYGVDKLVWWESGASREGVWRRENQIKKWRRAWKIELIERSNPEWRDLYWDLVGSPV
jgi:putative endonuclease